MAKEEPPLRVRQLDREAGGFVDTPEGPVFRFIIPEVRVPLKMMLKTLPPESISKIIRECEAELGERSRR